TDTTEAPLFRIPIEPSDGNGLRAPSRLMVDKLTTISKERLGSRIGRLDDEDMVRLNRAILVFLGMAGSSRT
ncbi:MAG: type II toxin-antitoxin system PemK/MazF family toxin, partial [Gemmatimonadetes bacterium]|nr:type II toxin-antitoxin system PemK/MazF family toxin [Gemmatimonadota bacterium]NNM05344.1 type II toxin-antitoxin system PemK/MazF family toxin [Gemmatimonadota bacterium]